MKRLATVFSLACVMLLHLGISDQAFALDPDKSIFQFNTRNWTRQNGLPADKINSVLQTPDGYIWLGTQNGLVRYDGQEFKVISVDLPEARGQEIRQLTRASNGGLWFAVFDGNFGGYHAGEFIAVGDERWDQFRMEAASILETRDHAIWTGANMGLGRWLPGTPASTFLEESTDGATLSLYEDPSGRVWMGTAKNGLFFWENETLTRVPDDLLSERNIYALAMDDEGRLWVGTEFGLLCYDRDGQLLETPPFEPEIKALLVDRHGVLWIGTTGMGLARYQHGEFSVLGKIDGLGSDFVTSLAEDAEGSLWIGTRDGLSQLSDVRFPIVTSRDGIVSGSVHTVTVSQHGGLWITATNGLSHFDGQNARNYGLEFPFPNHYIRWAFEARNGDVYLADGDRNLALISGEKLTIVENSTTWQEAMAEDGEGLLVGVGPGLFRLRDGALQPYEFAAGPVDFNWINHLHVAQDDAIWASTNSGIYRVQDGRVRHWSQATDLPTDRIHFIMEDEDGSIWAGTAAGLVRIRGDDVSIVNAENGLHDNRAFAIVPDRLGFFWINSGRGIFRVARQSLNDCADGVVTEVECESFDGMEAVRFTDRTDQGYSGCRTADGRIWFPNPHGVVMIDPANYFTNDVAPPVHIEEVRVNGATLGRDKEATLQSGDARVEFFFSALSFFAPDKIQVRYRLDGLETEWVDAGTRRSALYNKLDSGTYTFHVQACNADGVWNTAGAEFGFVLPPPFYETAWFRALCALAVLLVIAAGFRWQAHRMQARQRELQAQNDLLEANVLKRTEELARANASLQGEVEQRKNTEIQLKQRTNSLESEIEERKRMQLEIERVHHALVETSRKAGMAEVATSVLHNVGNVLNSVNVSATVLSDRMHQSEVVHLGRVCELLRKHEVDLGDFLTRDPQGSKIPAFLETLGAHLTAERSEQLQEIDVLRKNVEHIKEIVAMQQAYAKVSGIMETLPVVELVEDAIRINVGALKRHQVTLVRDYQATPTLTVDKHKVLQILVNLIRNAKYACDESDSPERQITIRVTDDAEKVRIVVIDNGVGIPAENMTRIFTHGFTTRKDGHGFGLHSGALAAQEMDGALSAQSGGPGQGATFTLELPLHSADASRAKPPQAA